MHAPDRLFGRCEATTGIAPFGRLVEQVMGSEPYASAARVFSVVDNGSAIGGRHRSTGWRGLADPAADASAGPWLLVELGGDLPSICQGKC
jgi:hypothetical protein